LRVYVNPDTGEFEAPREARRPAGEERDAVPARRQGAVRQPEIEEIEGLPSNHGVALRLHGRFHSHVEAKVGADGEVETDCLQQPATTATDPKP
jgi:hypothetical protein